MIEADRVFHETSRIIAGLETTDSGTVLLQGEDATNISARNRGVRFVFQHLTSVFVTHDQEEAIELADRVAIINHGIIGQEGTSDEVVGPPATPFVRNFFAFLDR